MATQVQFDELKALFVQAVKLKDERAYHFAVAYADRVLPALSQEALGAIEELRRRAANLLRIPNALQGHGDPCRKQLQALRDQTAQIAYLWNGCRNAGQSVPWAVKHCNQAVKYAETLDALETAEQMINKAIARGYLYRRGDALSALRSWVEAKRKAIRAAARTKRPAAGANARKQALAEAVQDVREKRAPVLANPLDAWPAE